MGTHRRYTRSFLLTLVLYGVIIVGLFLFFQALHQPKTLSKEKILSLNHISLIEQEKKEIKSKAPQKPPQKPVEKKRNEKPIEKPMKQKVEEKIVPKPLEKQKELVKKKEVTQEVKPEKEEEEKEQEAIQKSTQAYEKKFLDEHLRQIVQLIQKNINYPKRARILRIQGKVMVQFTILKNGSVEEIQALDGHRLLINSSIKAIENASKAFPTVEKSITIKVPIAYVLN